MLLFWANSALVTGSATLDGVGDSSATGGFAASVTLDGVSSFTATGTATGSAQSSGGFLYEFQRHHRARAKRLRDLETLADPIEREIAALLHEPDDEAELARLRSLVAEFTDKLPDPERVQRALNRAIHQETTAALRNLEQEMQRAIEDEDAALMLILN